MRRFALPAACLAAALAGCQEQKTVVIEQSQATAAAAVPSAPAPRPRHADILAPCSPPVNTGPFERLPPAINSVRIPKLARADAEGVSGCAGIRFRIGADGVAQDITVMADYPVGYGFGAAGARVVADSRWQPRDDLSLHYLRLLIRPHAPG